jgi:hypothetical protein
MQADREGAQLERLVAYKELENLFYGDLEGVAGELVP